MKYFLFLLVLFSPLRSYAAYFTNFEEAQKVALASNKLMLVDFTRSWCAPTTKPMGLCTLNLGDQNKVFQEYVFVQVDHQTISYYFKNFDFKISPEIFIIDANAKYIHSFSGFLDEKSMNIELEKFALSTDFLFNELFSYYKSKNYNTALRVYQKYLDYSLLVDKNIKSYFITLANLYFQDAKEKLEKKDLEYEEKNQKLNLFKLYQLVYNHDLESIEKKLNKIKRQNIKEGNINIFYFLKYIVAKGLQNQNLNEIEIEIAKFEDFDYFKDKADFILSRK